MELLTLREAVVKECKKAHQAIKSECQWLEDGLSASERRYRNEQQQELDGNLQISNSGELNVDTEDADIVYIGDINLLKGTNIHFLDLVEYCRDEDKFTIIALDSYTPQDQSHLDNYLNGTISIDQLRTKTRKKLNPNQEGIESILDYAKEKSIFVFGIGKNQYESPEEKDEFLAEEISTLMQKDPSDYQIFVLTDNESVARCHLPKKVTEKLGYAPKDVCVFQSEEEIFWQLMEQGAENTTTVVKINDKTYALNITHPLLKAITFAYSTEYETGKISPEEIKEEYFNLLREVLRLGLGLEEGYHKSLNIFTSDSNLEEKLKKLPSYKKMSPQEINEYLKSFSEKRSFYSTKNEFIYLPSNKMDVIIEELTHSFMLTKKEEDPNSEDFILEHFFITILREALGYIGAKTFEPNKKNKPILDYLSQDTYQNIIKLIGIVPYLKSIDDLFPEDFTAFSAMVHSPNEIEFDEVTHFLGQSLGDKIYKLVEEGKFPKEEFLNLFAQDFVTSGTAWEEYNRLIKIIRS